MKRLGITHAFAFDRRFSQMGFTCRSVGGYPPLSSPSACIQHPLS